MDKGHDAEAVKFYDLVDSIAKLCKEKGEISLAQVESLAKAKEIRPAAVLDDLAIMGYDVNLSQGKVICR